MPSIFRKWARKVGGRTQKTDGVPALFETGRRLLAQYDCYDNRVSVVRITKEAKVSLGTFYARFQSKDEFIYSLNHSTFRVLLERAAEMLDDELFTDTSVETILQKIAHRVVSDLGDPRTAGVMRAALKLAPNMPDIAKPLRDYRALIVKRTRALLAEHDRHKLLSDRIDVAIQMLFGTIIDTIIEEPGPLRLGSDEMGEALGDMLTGYLAIFPERGRAEIEAKSLEDRSIGQENRPAREPEGRHRWPSGIAPIIDPESRKVTGAKRIATKQRKRSRRNTTAAEHKTAMVKPSAFQIPLSKPDKAPAGKRRKRGIRIV